MDKYVSVNKLKTKIISGEPILFDEPTQHEIFFLLELLGDVKPVVHAYWIKNNYDNVDGTIYKCSNCNTEFFNAWNYCPDCGAKMDEQNGSR